MNNKMLGKIIFRNKKNSEGVREKTASFSPACCFSYEKLKNGSLKTYPLKKGENIIVCECGKKYRVVVNGEFDEFEKYTREAL